ncbi:MAG: hypothetical protein U1C58_09415 [Flavobacteriaceae bacterium]|nr:hypothetical protein [Flavobacteriaceae bacterium]MDZ4148488.1 hypothetical protein [Flavobacteriaceae bacterium]
MIIFSKERNFEQLITATFQFIRQEYKPFLGIIIRITGPFLILMLIGLTGYLNSMNSFSSSLIDVDTSSPVQLIVSITLIVLFGGSAYLLAHAAALFYIESYIANSGKVDPKEVQRKTFGSFFSFLGLGIVSIFLIFFGIILCIIPGIYLAIPLSLVFSVLVFEKRDVIESVETSLKLIKDEWWNSFLFLLVIGILLGVAGSVFSIPAAIYMFIKMFISSGSFNPSSLDSLGTDYIYLTMNVLSYALQFFLNLISIVATAFLYFSISEKKTGKGIGEIIENIGH